MAVDTKKYDKKTGKRLSNIAGKAAAKERRLSGKGTVGNTLTFINKTGQQETVRGNEQVKSKRKEIISGKEDSPQAKKFALDKQISEERKKNFIRQEGKKPLPEEADIPSTEVQAAPEQPAEDVTGDRPQIDIDGVPTDLPAGFELPSAFGERGEPQTNFEKIQAQNNGQVPRAFEPVYNVLPSAAVGIGSLGIMSFGNVLNTVKKPLLSKTGKALIGTVAGLSGIISWLASDNIIGAADIWTRDVANNVKFNGADPVASVQLIDDAMSNANEAKAFVNTATSLNPLMWPFRNMVLTNADAAIGRMQVRKDEILNQEPAVPELTEADLV